MGDLGIDLGIAYLENGFGELGEYELFVRSDNDTGVCHVPVAVVENKFSPRIGT